METRILTLAVSIACILPCSGQLNTLHNHFRPGDVLVKQQVEYAGPGEPGGNKLWDFNKVKTVNDEYTLTYSLPPLEGDSVYISGYNRYKKRDVSDNELIVGTEHNTMYYYRLTNDSLLQLGHENPTVKLEYTRPMTLMRFPLNYGQAVASDYKSKGLYSGTVDIQAGGRMITSADAYGRMVLPTGDTLSPVLRIKTIQTIFDKTNNTEAEETGETGNRGTQLETCRWYSKGYRYPVFETIRSTNLDDNSEIFSTAFFFPPQDHLYLDTDPDNLALLDELWKETENSNQANDLTAKTVTLEDIMTCKIYPNPVELIMNLEYELKQDAKVSFELYSMDGMPDRKIVAKNKAKGIYYETLDCSSLYPKNYVLRITANNLFVNEIIIKK
jgi:hypothetical protein